NGCSQLRGDCNGSKTDGCEVDLATDPKHCGSCQHACSFANASAGCTNGLCTILSCNPGFANCDQDAQNGCEANACQLSFDFASSSAVSNAATLEWLHTSAGDQRLLLVGVGLRKDPGVPSVVSVTYGVTPLTSVGVGTDGYYQRTELWSLVNPPA